MTKYRKDLLNQINENDDNIPVQALLFYRLIWDVKREIEILQGELEEYEQMEKETLDAD